MSWYLAPPSTAAKLILTRNQHYGNIDHQNDDTTTNDNLRGGS